MNQLKTARLIVHPFSMADLQESHQLLDLDLQWSGPAFSLEQRKDRLERYIMLSQWEEGESLYASNCS